MGHPAGFGHMRWMIFLGAMDKAEAYGPALRDGLNRTGFETASILAAALGDTPVADPIDRSLRLDLMLYLPENILLKVDRMSMATSLEARVPFLDHRLVEYAVRLPTRFKIRGFRRKWILRRAVRGWVPRSVLARKKSGFSIPMKTWLRSDLRHLIERLDEGEIVRGHGLIEASHVRRLVGEHLEGRADHAHRLWPMVMLEWWIAHVLKVKAGAGPGRKGTEVERKEGGISRHGS